MGILTNVTKLHYQRSKHYLKYVHKEEDRTYTRTCNMTPETSGRPQGGYLRVVDIEWSAYCCWMIRSLISLARAMTHGSCRRIWYRDLRAATLILTFDRRGAADQQENWLESQFGLDFVQEKCQGSYFCIQLWSQVMINLLILHQTTVVWVGSDLKFIKANQTIMLIR